ncbi:MAG: hypothetical protein ABIG10_02095 [bacterium]
MPKQNLNQVEHKIIKKYEKKDKRKRPKMKVSGANVKHLQRIIKQK